MDDDPAAKQPTAAPAAVAPPAMLGPGLFAAAALACGVFASGLIARPVGDLVGCVSDDAFYYLAIARNIAATGTPTFDGVHATNGFHPGWMAVATLLAKLFAEKETLLRAALWTSFAIHVATALVLVRLCRRFVPAFWSWVLGALWTINPLPITLAMQGVETPLVLLTWTVVADVFAARFALRARQADAGRIPTRDLALLGAALAAAVWARTDAAWLAVATVLAVAVLVPTRVLPRCIGIVGGACAAGVAPWLAWSLATTGTIVQDSGAIKMQWASHARTGAGQALADGAEFLAGRWFGLPASLLLTSPALVGTVAGVAFAAFVAASVVVSARRSRDRRLRVTTCWLALAVVGLGLLDGCLLTDRLVWYHAAPGLALFLVGALWIAADLAAVARLRDTVVHCVCGVGLVVAAITLFFRYAQRMPFDYPWQRDVFASQHEFERLVPKGAKIGCFNAGIPGYFGARTVVNLDGLVNHPLVDVYARGSLDRWLADEGIVFIADEPLALGRAQALTSAPLRLRVVSSAPLHGWPRPTRFLWRVERP